MTSYYDASDVTEIDSIDGLLSEFKEFRGRREDEGGEVYLRGHAKEEWPLVPTIGRIDAYRYGNKTIDKFTKDEERGLFDRFCRYSQPHFGRILDKWEALFVAKHHDLPVRLLDWTSNPLVALFNAIGPEDNMHNSGAVWLMRRKRDTSKDIDVFEQLDPFAIQGVRMIYPTYPSPRLITQSGFFTIHAGPWRDLKEVKLDTYPNEDFDVHGLKKLLVTVDSKEKVLPDLERLGINNRTLFPDLDHLAKGLWQLEIIRQHRSWLA